jgi:myo-inositol-1(or 4)-monophosphatase
VSDVVPAPDELLAVAVRAARAGATVLLEGLARPAEVVHKNERTSIVTWADVNSQRAVFEVIGAAFPDHAILGEEGDGGAAESELTWLVDPLDGTSNYAHGIPFACVSVAVRDRARVLAGAVLEPFRGELFTAMVGGGAFVERIDIGSGTTLPGGEPIRLSVSGTNELRRALICTGLQSDDSDRIAAYGRRVVALHERSRGARSLGSPALTLAYVAAGRVDGYMERDATYAWDVGAGSLLITEAGGRCEHLDGGNLNLGRGFANVLASNGTVHEELADLVRDVDGVPA